jgi:hypothetical protein
MGALIQSQRRREIAPGTCCEDLASDHQSTSSHSTSITERITTLNRYLRINPSQTHNGGIVAFARVDTETRTAADRGGGKIDDVQNGAGWTQVANA